MSGLFGRAIFVFFAFILSAKALGNFENELLEKLILAEPGDVIEIPEGIHEITRQLSLTVSHVTIKGKGKNKSILSFKNQSSGAEGLYITANNVTLENFSILDTKGDSVKAINSHNLVIRGMKVGWTNGISTDNGGYGLYPVKSENILIEDCEAFGASDSGIYVGQSKNIIVRNNYVYDNVSGVEIENSERADVYGNRAENNTGGILIFNLPGLSMYGSKTRVYNNLIKENNTRNFAAPGNVVASVPKGTGVMVMANSQVEIFDNIITGNNTTAFLIMSYHAVSESEDLPSGYDPLPKSLYFYNNKIENSGLSPEGGASENSQAQVEVLKMVLGERFPDILYGGFASLTEDRHENKHRICLEVAGDTSFVNLDVEHQFEFLTKDKSFYSCQLEKLEPVVLSL